MKILTYTEERRHLSWRQWEKGFRVVSIRLEKNQVRRVRDILKPQMPALGINYPSIQICNDKDLEILWNIHHDGDTSGAVKAVESILAQLNQEPQEGNLF